MKTRAELSEILFHHDVPKEKANDILDAICGKPIEPVAQADSDPGDGDNGSGPRTQPNTAQSA